MGNPGEHHVGAQPLRADFGQRKGLRRRRQFIGGHNRDLAFVADLTATPVMGHAHVGLAHQPGVTITHHPLPIQRQGWHRTGDEGAGNITDGQPRHRGGQLLFGHHTLLFENYITDTTRRFCARPPTSLPPR